MEFIRVNMSAKEISRQPVPEQYRALGGRALSSLLVAEEVVPGCHPLGEDNKLVFAPGMLAGTRAPSSGRLSVGGKSPLTGSIKESNAGGISGQKLAGLGIRALIIEGMPKEEEGWFILKLSPSGAELLPAGDLAGLGTYEVTDKLRKAHGEKVAVISIGPAGEMKMAGAGVATNDADGNSSRYAGRGGLGAVMGSKRLKAIVVDSPGSFDAAVAHPEKFQEAAKRFSEQVLAHPVTGQGLAALGTNVLMNIINEAGALPTRNFTRGQFAGANNIGGEKLAEVAVARGGKATHACMPGCIMRCSNEYPLPDGKVCSPIEYESAWALGAHCEIGDLDVVGKLNYICNDVGLDTIEAGGTLGVLMEAGVIPFGDGAKAVESLEEVGKGTPLGRIIGQGAGFAGKAFGVTRVAVTKNQHMPAYDPRGAKGIGVTYATSPMGADHTAGYAIGANILKSGGDVNPLSKEGQVDLSRNLQIVTAALDSTGMCLFVAFPLGDLPDALPALLDMINACYDVQWTPNEFLALGQQVLKTEREFNIRAGLGKIHDRLPEFMEKEKLAPHKQIFDIPGEELDQVFNFMD